MKPEDQLGRKFEELDFSNEPAMASQPDDDIRRGERRLRRRRAGLVTAGVAAVAVVATSAAVVLPNVLQPSAQLQVAGGPDGTPRTSPSPETPETPVTPTNPPTESPRSAPPDPFPYPATRQLLLDAAVQHLDPQRKHLPVQSTNAQTGGSTVGSKLDWTVSGEDGMGKIQVVVTTPDYDESDHALDDLLGTVGCYDYATGKTLCEKQTIPGAPGQAWVADADPKHNLKLGVLYERADGSYLGIGVYDLFGNNTNTPVSNVDVSLEQAIAFVTDPDPKVVPGDDSEGDLGRPK